MRVNVKKGVRFKFIDDRFISLAQIFWEEYQKEGITPTVTSADDGNHAPNSWHYRGLGWDWRIWGLKNPQEVADRIRARLKEVSGSYRIIFGDPAHLDHIHSEFREGGLEVRQCGKGEE